MSLRLEKILLSDPKHLEIRYNGEWLGKMNLVDIIELAARKSVAQVLTREDFAKRYAKAWIFGSMKSLSTASGVGQCDDRSRRGDGRARISFSTISSAGNFRRRKVKRAGGDRYAAADRHRRHQEDEQVAGELHRRRRSSLRVRMGCSGKVMSLS